jgi:uncharacterized protein (TIGR00661 family)
LCADPVNKEHITVYLSHYSDTVIEKALAPLKDLQFHIFTRSAKMIQRKGNLLFMPVNNEAFTNSMISSQGVITGAGFETPAEALYMGKRLLCLPIQGQYEQLCNAAALQEFNVPIISSITDNFSATVDNWINGDRQVPLQLQHSTADIIGKVMDKADEIIRNRNHIPHNLNFSVG